MAHAPVRNPLPYVESLNAPPKLTPSQRALARRVAAVDASRAQEETTMAMQMQDLNPGATHQSKATFTPKKSTAPPAPEQPKFQRPPLAGKPAAAAVQRVALPVQAEAPSIFDEIDAELNAPSPAPAAPPAPVDADQDVETILARYKGSPDEVARQIAKSYKESEKRMRQLENERRLFAQGQPMNVQGQPVASAPSNQMQVVPDFNYKSTKEILDKPEEIFENFEKHVVNKNYNAVAKLVGPVADALMEERIYRKFGDVINEDNIDIVKAMAQNEPGQNPMEKLIGAATKYRAAMTPAPSAPNADVHAMQSAAQTPSPQARVSGDKKMWKESVLRDEMQRLMRKGGAAWQEKRHLFDQAFRDGRVLRGQ